jgi:hypothetical protein
MTNEQIFIIVVIAIIWAILIANVVGNTVNKKIEGPIQEKVCPPHKWAWEEQIGVEPAVHYIRCQRCRRLPGWDNK